MYKPLCISIFIISIFFCVFSDFQSWPHQDLLPNVQFLNDTDAATCSQLGLSSSHPLGGTSSYNPFVIYTNITIPGLDSITVILHGQNVCNSCHVNVFVTDNVVNINRLNLSCGFTCDGAATCTQKYHSKSSDTCTFDCHCPYDDCQALVISSMDNSVSLCEVFVYT